MFDFDVGIFPDISQHDVGARASINVLDIGLLNISANYTGEDNPYGESELSSLGASFVLPLFKYFSTSFSLNGLEFTRDSFKQEMYGISGRMFLHDIKYGIIGTTLGYSENKSSRQTLYDGQVSSYSLYGSYYFDDITVNATTYLWEFESREWSDSNASWNVSANLYPLDNTKLTVQGNIVNSNKNFSVLLNHQLFDNLILGFKFDTQDINPPNSMNTYGFNLIYHFGNKSTMKSRDRNFQQTGVTQ